MYTYVHLSIFKAQKGTNVDVQIMKWFVVLLDILDKLLLASLTIKIIQ